MEFTSKMTGITVDFKAGLQRAKGFVNGHGITWTQAEQGSIYDFERDRLQVEGWPTQILVGPNGKIIRLIQYGMLTKVVDTEMSQAAPENKAE